MRIKVPVTRAGANDYTWRGECRSGYIAAREGKQNSSRDFAADLLGMNPNTLASRLRSFGIRGRRMG
jgi:hypothetical protein